MTTNLNQESVGEAPDGFEIRWPSFEVWRRSSTAKTASEHFYSRGELPDQLVGTVTAISAQVPSSDMYTRKMETRITYQAKAADRNFKAQFESSEAAIRWLIAEAARLA